MSSPAAKGAEEEGSPERDRSRAPTQAAIEKSLLPSFDGFVGVEFRAVLLCDAYRYFLSEQLRWVSGEARQRAISARERSCDVCAVAQRVVVASTVSGSSIPLVS